MFYQIALSVALLILAFTTLPKVATTPDKPAAREQMIERPERLEPRPIQLHKPQAIDVRVGDPPLNEIAHWLSANFALPYASDPPRLERVAPARLCRLRYKTLLAPRSQAIGEEPSALLQDNRRELVAIYDDTSRTIYLPDSWTGATVAEQSVLVHEMVHHLQNLAGLKYECGGAREKIAYLAQDQWLKRHGLALEDEFEVDMFTIVALSACMN